MADCEDVVPACVSVEGGGRQTRVGVVAARFCSESRCVAFDASVIFSPVYLMCGAVCAAARCLFMLSVGRAVEVC